MTQVWHNRLFPWSMEHILKRACSSHPEFHVQASLVGQDLAGWELTLNKPSVSHVFLWGMAQKRSVPSAFRCPVGQVWLFQDKCPGGAHSPGSTFREALTQEKSYLTCFEQLVWAHLTLAATLCGCHYNCPILQMRKWMNCIVNNIWLKAKTQFPHPGPLAQLRLGTHRSCTQKISWKMLVILMLLSDKYWRGWY